MPRTRASVPPEAIRIEDEVWQEAFARREPARPRPERRLHAIDGGRGSDRLRPDRRPLDHPRTRPTGDGLGFAGAPEAGQKTQPPVTFFDQALADVPPAPRPRTAAGHRTPGGPAAPGPTTEAPPSAGGVPGRRTVTIRGYGAERNLPWPDGTTRRPQRRPHERSGFKPDRVAMWAVMLGILLVIVAVASPH